MSEVPENLKKSAKEHSDKLAKLGMELGEIQFSYKIEEKVTKEYWQQRIKDFKKYNEKGLEYYNQVHAMMDLVSISTFNRLTASLVSVLSLGMNM